MSLAKDVHDLYEVVGCQVKEQCGFCLVQVIEEPVAIVNKREVQKLVDITTALLSSQEGANSPSS